MILRAHSCYVLLKENEGLIFRLTFSDGEVALAKVIHVDDEHEDFVYDLISSTVLERNKNEGRECYAGKLVNLVAAELKEEENKSV
jgi:hypothetical protein